MKQFFFLWLFFPVAVDTDKMFYLEFQNSYVLPLNFEEVATGVLKVLNSMALVHIELLQGMLVSFLCLKRCALDSFMGLFGVKVLLNSCVLEFARTMNRLDRT